MTFPSKCGLVPILMLLIVTTHAISGEASPVPSHDPIERAKNATVGVLRHATDSSYQTTQSQFAIRGSGVHLGEGYILTARHAVERQEGSKVEIPQTIHIVTDELAEFSAELVGVNGFLDLALYRFTQEKDAGELPFVSFGEDELRQGDEVFTVGYPLGWGPALAFGHLGNPQTFLPTAQSRLMQVDLTACSGNSGGGLFSSQGSLVGMVHAIIQTESNESERRCSRFAFAVPGPSVEKIVTALKAGKSLRFPKLGIHMTVVKVGQQWRVAVAKAKGPARKAGVRKNDILLAIDQTPITSASQLKSHLIENTIPGQTIELHILRDQTEKVLKVILGEI